MKKRIMSVLLCICMVFTLMPVTAWAAAGDHADKVKVAGTELTATGYYEVSNLKTKLEDAPASPDSNGYVHWESTTGTLTLYGATIDGGNSSGIYANQNYTIMLSENTVSNVTSGCTNAVTSDGSVTIKGSGTLNATGATNGIDADYTVSITDGATVNATGTNGMGIFISYRYSYWDGLRIESDAASVTISGNTYGVGYANTSTSAPPEIKSPNVTVTGEIAAFQIAPTLNGVGAKASDNINGDDPKTYDSTKLSNYKWFKSEALPSVSVTGVTVDPASLSLTVGDSNTLTATVAPNNATNKTVAWTSSNSNVAAVDTNGKVTAVAAGSATITATTEDGDFSDTCAVTVTVSSVTEYDLYVGGTQVTSANAANVLGDGTVSYDADRKTLTLNGATITGDNGAEKKEGIYADDSLKIVLQGENTVTASGNGANAIITIGSLTFEGTGTLNATSSGYCIQAHGGNIIISGTTVNAEGTGNNSRGIYASWNAGAGGDITISDSTVTAKGETYGICASSITISDSTVTADATTTRDGVSVHGISSDDGSVSITDSTVAVTATCTNWGSYGISCSPFNNAKITITDSTVTAKTATAEGYTSKAKALSAAPEFGDPSDWYQWTTTEGGTMTKSTDTLYTYDASHTYLKIEPTSVPVTNYDLWVGGGSYDDDDDDSSSTYRDQEEDFWKQVEKKIREAKSGNKVIARAGGYDRMPAYVMESLYERGDIMLEVHWNGDTITISAGKALIPESGRINYPLSYLEDIDFGVLAANIDPTKLNPETGGDTFEIAVPLVSNTITTPDAKPEIAVPTLDTAAQPQSRSALWYSIWILLAALTVGGGWVIRKKCKEKAAE